MSNDLRTRRKACGLTQQRLAELAPCSIQMVQALESGYRPGESVVMGRIERVLTEHEAGSSNNRSDADTPHRPEASAA